MINKYLRFTTLFFSAVLLLSVTSCKKDDPEPEEDNNTSTTPAFRTRIEYSTLTPTTPYAVTFKDENGDTTVDRRDGQVRLSMLRAMDVYAKTSNNTGTAILDSQAFENMFANKNNGFVAPYTILNGSPLQVRNVTAYSRSTAQAAAIRAKFSEYFGKIAEASESVNNVASAGNAGKMTVDGTTTAYLLDAKGVEYAQVIAKSFIGAFQLDYICNVLLDKGLTVNNSYLVTGTNYTQLEHNWDVAYGILTVKDIYAGTATSSSNGGETFLGSYVWEYNKDEYTKIYPALLKGRAAIVNNDINEVKAQAAIIRSECEEAIANAAIGYLDKWKENSAKAAADNVAPAAATHQLAEGLGFIYSLRFCKLNNADDAFSDQILNDLGVFTGNGVWDLTPAKANAAKAAIQAKFGI